MVVSVYKNSVMLIVKITLTLGFPTYSPRAICGLPSSIMCLVSTFVNYVYTKALFYYSKLMHTIIKS